MNIENVARTADPSERRATVSKSKIPVTFSRCNTTRARSTNNHTSTVGYRKPTEQKHSQKPTTLRSAFGSTIRKPNPPEKKSNPGRRAVPSRAENAVRKPQQHLKTRTRQPPTSVKSDTNNSNKRQTFVRVSADLFEPARDVDEIFKDRTNVDPKRQTTFLKKTVSNTVDKIDNNEPQERNRLSIYRRNTTCSLIKPKPSDNNIRAPLNSLTENFNLQTTPIKSGATPKRTPRRLTIYNSSSKKQKAAEIKQLDFSSATRQPHEVRSVKKAVSWQDEITEEIQTERQELKIDIKPIKPIKSKRVSYISPTFLENVRKVEAELLEDVSFFVGDVDDSGSPKMDEVSISGLCEQLGGGLTIIDQSPLLPSPPKRVSTIRSTQPVIVTQNIVSCSPIIEHTENHPPADLPELFTRLLPRSPASVEHSAENSLLETSPRVSAFDGELSFLNVLDRLNLSQSNMETSNTPSNNPLLKNNDENTPRNPLLNFVDGEEITPTVEEQNLISFDTPTLPKVTIEKRKEPMHLLTSETSEKPVGQGGNRINIDNDNQIFIKSDLMDFTQTLTPEKVQETKSGSSSKYSKKLTLRTPVIKNMGNTIRICSPKTEQKSTLENLLLTPVSLSSKLRQTPGHHVMSQRSRYRDLLVDNEVADHMLKISSPSSALRHRRDVMDGLSQLLDEADEIHFIPIKWELSDSITERQTTDQLWNSI